MDEYDQLLAELVQDARVDYLLIAIDEAVIDQAIVLTRRHKLRGYDAVHLACALALQQVLAAGEGPAATFIAADCNLLTAAAAEGLATDNHDDYP